MKKTFLGEAFRNIIRSKRQYILRISLAIVSLAISFLLLELISRIFSPVPYIDYFDPTITLRGDSRHFALKPHYNGRFTGVNVKLNSFGFRDEELGQINSKFLRILALGDSVFFGYRVPQNLDGLSLTESEALKRGINLEIINTAVPAYALPHEIASYEHYSKILDPEVVLVGFVLNDIKLPQQIEILNNSKQDTSNLSFGSRITKFIVGHSKLASFLFSKSPNILFKLGYSKPFEGRLAGDLDTDSMAIIHSNIETNTAYKQKYNQALVFFENELKRLIDKTGDNGDRLIFVLFPWREQISKKCWSSYQGDLLWKNVPLDDYALEAIPQKDIVRILNRNGVRYLDLLPSFRVADMKLSECDLMFDRTHPTELGHKVTSHALLDFLIKEKLIHSN